jgi:hypothetical protein
MKPNPKSEIPACAARSDDAAGWRNPKSIRISQSESLAHGVGTIRHFKFPLRAALCAVCLLPSAFCLAASPLGTAFTYQGKLTDGGPSANGLYDFEFTLFDAAIAGNHVAGPLTIGPLGVTNGLFTAELDFGPGAFTGEARWLGTAVRTTGVGAFATFPARQLLTPAPYALYAPQAGSAVTIADNSVTAQRLSTPAPPAAGQVLTFDGTTLAWSNPGAVSGAWSLGGNAGTTPGLNFLGTTDDRPLEFNVNGQRALRLEPKALSPNIIGGFSGNFVSDGSDGSTIGAGGGFGLTNSILSSYAVIAGGSANTIATNSQSSAIGGGSYNAIAGNSIYAAIGGGGGNTIATYYATITGGALNDIGRDSQYSVIGGGYNNNIAPNSGLATIAGGEVNDIGTNCFFSAIAGGRYNKIADNSRSATIGGGERNAIETNAFHGTISGGEGHTIGAWARHAAVSGGSGNTIEGEANYASIGGGVDNKIQLNAMASTIGGGSGNLIGTNAGEAIIGGGRANRIQFQAFNATIGGGVGNSIGDNSVTSLIGGGYGNEIQSYLESATIGGGWGNVIQTGAVRATVGGGMWNTIETNAYDATIGGGRGNTASVALSTIAGGMTNTASGYAATVGGGQYNAATNSFATIGGGNQNVAGLYGTVPGGALNHATGDFSFAAGRRANAHGKGSFVWGDSTDAEVAAWGANQFVVRATGGYWLYSGVAPSTGVTLSPGDGSWSSMSDRNAKANAEPVDARAVLDKVAALPIATWNYKAQDPSIRHIGPMAQDFTAAFGVGDSDKTITTVDADGVALAAIQGLNQKLEAVVQEKDARIAELERRLAALEELVKAQTK